MKQVSIFELPETEIEIISVKPRDKGACIVSTMSAAGSLELYCPATLLNGYTPKVGDHCAVNFLLSGAYEKSIELASIRPSTSGKA